MKYIYINNFFEYLINEKNYSSYTIVSYKNDLLEFFKFINKNELDILESDIKNYLNELYNRNLKVSSISRKISALKSFYSYLITKNIITINPLEYIGYPKKEKKLPKFLFYDELEHIIEESKSGKFGLRNSLIIELLYATGLRVSELVNIKLNDIDLSSRKITVLGKGSYERVVYYGECAGEILNKYLNSFRNINVKNKKHDYLFINKNGDKITDRGVRLILDKILKNVSVKTKISPHSIRHTFATHLLDNGCDIKVVQELLGHKHLSATEIYTHVSNERLREVYYKCHPRSGKKNE